MCIQNERLFSEEEEIQLKGLFEFEDDDLKLVLDCCCYIFEQAAFTSTGPEPLYGILLEAGFDEAHGKVVGKIWAIEAAEFVGRLKVQPLGYSSLRSSDHRLNMLMGISNLTRLQEPTALFEFTVDSPNMALSEADKSSTTVSTSVDGKVNTEKVTVEFSHQELFSLFTQLERVQSQLDGLSST